MASFEKVGEEKLPFSFSLEMRGSYVLVHVSGDESLTDEELRKKIGLRYVGGSEPVLIVGSLAERSVPFLLEVIDKPKLVLRADDKKEKFIVVKSAMPGIKEGEELDESRIRTVLGLSSKQKSGKAATRKKKTGN